MKVHKIYESTVSVPYTRQSSHISTEVHKCIDDHRCCHDTVNAGSTIRLLLQQLVNESVQPMTVRAVYRH